ncbi:MAG: CoA transferase [Desulfarculus sp.]|nr:CoA transferase [Pseudomonadota bacterium]MBU4576446.1 CoA transferase [Pseudomonadota bacterium]MBU4596292.1 CoA transferase [Pseudomonadota bacterium]MBV1715361.1 CoA transferase [Desulfarculus sp.]MBV1737556.1 CoA transferase [Desulfarculus sp.]
MQVLSGIRVLDFTRVLAGPYATRVLADFGAEVIKVQCRKTALGAEANQTPYFDMYNRNKKSVTLDLDQPQARELVLALVQKCDVVAENFSPRVLENWRLTYPVLKQAKPDIILLRMSAMGQNGPWRDAVAFGPTIQSLTGFTQLTAYPDSPPLGLGFSHADVASGLYGALAVLAALEVRDRHGLGQCIDLAEYEAVATLLGPELLAAQLLPGQAHSHQAPFAECLACSGEDRWCAVSLESAGQWRAFCRVLELPSIVAETDFESLGSVSHGAKKIRRAVAQAAAGWKAEDLTERLQEAGIAAGVVQNAEDLRRDPQLAGRGFFRTVPNPAGQDAITDDSPIRFDGGTGGEWRAAPRLGQHNLEVFGELLGMRAAEIAELERSGVIA